jgi:hypothetical protein
MAHAGGNGLRYDLGVRHIHQFTGDSAARNSLQNDGANRR